MPLTPEAIRQRFGRKEGPMRHRPVEERVIGGSLILNTLGKGMSLEARKPSSETPGLIQGIVVVAHEVSVPVVLGQEAPDR